MRLRQGNGMTTAILTLALLIVAWVLVVALWAWFMGLSGT